MERRKLKGNISILVVVTLLGAVWQSGMAAEDFRDRFGSRPIGPPGPVTPPASDSVAVTIVNPAAAAIETSDASMVLQGLASGGAGIASVYWTSNRGPAGVASGAVNWQTGPIPLSLGANEITVTANDWAGGSASDAIVIRRESKQARSVTLNWTAPTRRIDGSLLTDLAGYTIQYGRTSRFYDYKIRIDNPGVVSYVVADLKPGVWYFSMTAFDSDGVESKLSNEAIRQLL